MAKSSLFRLIAAGILVAALVISAEAGGNHQEMGWIPVKRSCQGSIAECRDTREFEMYNEMNRRILATTQYLSYGVLMADKTLHARRGTSYYNCREGGEANPYTRGCSTATGCRS